MDHPCTVMFKRYIHQGWEGGVHLVWIGICVMTCICSFRNNAYWFYHQSADLITWTTDLSTDFINLNEIWASWWRKYFIGTTFPHYCSALLSWYLTRYIRCDRIVFWSLITAKLDWNPASQFETDASGSLADPILREDWLHAIKGYRLRQIT